MKTLGVVCTDFCSEDLAVARDGRGGGLQRLTATTQPSYVSLVTLLCVLSVIGRTLVMLRGAHHLKTSSQKSIRLFADRCRGFLVAQLGIGIARFIRGLNVKHSQMETLHGVTYGIMSTCIFVVLFLKVKWLV